MEVTHLNVPSERSLDLTSEQVCPIRAPNPLFLQGNIAAGVNPLGGSSGSITATAAPVGERDKPWEGATRPRSSGSSMSVLNCYDALRVISGDACVLQVSWLPGDDRVAAA